MQLAQAAARPPASGPGSARRAHDPDQLAVGRIARAARRRCELLRQEALGVVRARRERSDARLRVERLHDHPAAARARGRCGRRAAPRARRCAPRRGSRGSAAWSRRRARRRASRPGSRGPSPPSACRPARPPGAASKRPQHAGDAPRARGRVRVEPEHRQRRDQRLELALELLRARRRGARPTPSRSRGMPTAPAPGGRSGGRPPRAAARCRTSVTSQLGQLPDAAADAAREEVRPAAPVQQHDRLLARGARTSSSASRVRGCSARRHARPSPTQLDRRQPRPSTRSGSSMPLVAQPALRARRGAAGHAAAAPACCGAPLGHVRAS